MATDDAEVRTATLLAQEPAYRLALYRILMLCRTPRSTAEIEEAVRTFPEMQVPFQTPRNLLSWLVRAGAIEQVAAQPEKRGTDQALWQTTAAGARVAEREAPSRRLRQLLAEQPRYSDVYLQVLRFCLTPRKRSEIEALLEGNPVLEEPKVYASFFLQNLEEKGGLEWVDNHWQTTQAGQSVLG